MEILYIATAILFLALPEATASSAELAVSALKNVVIKSLFPMMILSRLISRSRLMSSFSARLAKSFFWRRLSLSDLLLPSILTGLLSGLPSSAREINTLFREEKINKDEAKKALALASLPSPAFVILVASDTLATGLLRYAILVFSGYITALFFKSQKSLGRQPYPPMTFPEALSSSVASALSVSGNIVFFSAVSTLIFSLFPFLNGFASAFFEMGSGVIFANGNSFFISLSLGWCGLSAISQIKSEAPSVSLLPYLVSRAISTALLLLLALLQFFYKIP